MLNPGASEFKPAFNPPANDSTDQDGNKTNDHPSALSLRPTHKSRNKQKSKKASVTMTEKNITDPSTLSHEQKNSFRSSKKPTVGAAPEPSSRRKQPTQKTATASTQALKKARRPPTLPSIIAIHEQPATSFITIDQTIDPVHQVLQKSTLVHGYDDYVAWIERCLEAYPVVTVVGMDPAIADVISLMTLVQSRGIGSYHELDTFSMMEDERQPTCGIQIKLHRN